MAKSGKVSQNELNPMLHQNANEFKRYLENEPRLSQFGRDAHAVYSLSLYCEIDDLTQISDRHCTEGPNDKKCDYCIIEPELKTATIVQAYFDVNWDKIAAPANKAAGLGQAITWLLTVPIDQLPERLRPYALDLRDHIKNGEIENLRIIYLHNCPESDNVNAELRAVESQTIELVKSISDNKVKVTASELGLASTLVLHESSTHIIAVRDQVSIPGDFALVTQEPLWKSIQGVISGSDLCNLYAVYKDTLFSANVREYLGARNDARNINNGIKQTATSEPENFYAFNNGVTLLTRSFSQKPDGILCDGLSIVNGAQTTGALASVTPTDVKILCRVIACDDIAMIDKIVRYNNTQNAVRASDRKSNDPVQKRLEIELKELGFIYRRRRGQEGQGPTLHIDPVSQSLASFHNELNLAIRNRRDIFEVEASHRKLFNEQTSAVHILLIEALSRAISKVKWELSVKLAPTPIEKAQLDFLTYTAGKQFVLAVLGVIFDQLVGYEIGSRSNAKLSLAYARESHFAEAVDACEGIITVVLPLIVNETKDESYYSVVRSEKRLEAVASKVTSILAAISKSIEEPVNDFRQILQKAQG